MRTNRIYLALFVVGCTILSLSIAAGLAHSIGTDHRLPAVDINYMPEINALLAQKDYDQAIAKLRLAVKIEFQLPQPASMLYRTARAAGDLESQVFALRRILWFTPNNFQTHNELSTIILRIATSPDQFREAIKHSETALSLNPEYAPAHFTLGFAWLRLNDKPKAAMYFRQALALDPMLEPARQVLKYRLKGF